MSGGSNTPTGPEGEQESNVVQLLGTKNTNVNTNIKRGPEGKKEGNVVQLFGEQETKTKLLNTLGYTADLDMFSRKLGLGENEEMMTKRFKIEEMILKNEQYIALFSEYAYAIERGINETYPPSGNDFAKLHIALLIKKASIYKNGGHIEGCLDELHDAHTYSEEMGFQEIKSKIGDFILTLST